MDEISFVAQLSANDEAVLVGGMAVAVLAKHFAVHDGRPVFTKDADFVGGLMAIEQAEANLAQRFSVRKYIASLDEAVATPNFGKLAVDVAAGTEPVEIDFLYRLDGLSNDEIDQKAIEADLDGKIVRVIHPVLALENKIINLALFPGKRNEAGIGQAALIVKVVNKYLEQTEGRSALQAAERVARFAARDPACFAWKAFGIDVLDSIPASFVGIPDFGDKRLPQIRDRVESRRDKFSHLWDRMMTFGDPLKSR